MTLPATTIASSTSFSVAVTQVRNPPSLKPSSRFGFTTFTPNGLSQYSRNLTTVSVTNSVPSLFSSLSYTFTPQTLGTSTVASISFTPTSSVDGYAIVSLASSFSVQTLTCTSVAFTGSCTQQANPNTIKVTGSFSLSSMTLSISGFTSPKQVPTDATVFTTYDSSDFIIDQSSDFIKFTLACNLPCRTCSTDRDTCTSCYNDTVITPSIYFNSLTSKCVTICDNGYYPDAIQLKCLQCNSICGNCTGSANNCTSCVSTSGFPYLNKTATTGTCLAQCDSGSYPNTNQNPTLCVPCVAPCVTCTTQTACLSCNSTTFLLGTSCVTTCTANTTVMNTATRTCDPCDPVCATCSQISSNCTSCAANTALHNGNCVSTCPAPLVIKNGLCANCDSPCLTCSNTSTNCTSCISTSSTPHLHGNTCVAQCPSGFYNQTATGNCIDCTT